MQAVDTAPLMREIPARATEPPRITRSILPKPSGADRSLFDTSRHFSRRQHFSGALWPASLWHPHRSLLQGDCNRRELVKAGTVLADEIPDLRRVSQKFRAAAGRSHRSVSLQVLGSVASNNGDGESACRSAEMTKMFAGGKG